MRVARTIQIDEHVYVLNKDQYETYKSILGNLESYTLEEQRKLRARSLRYVKDNCKMLLKVDERYFPHEAQVT